MKNKRGNQLPVLRQIIIMVFLGGLILRPTYAFAAEAGVLNTIVYDGDIYVFIRGITQLQEGSSVQIGNVLCQEDQLSATAFQDMEISLRTLILVDNSKSISENGKNDIHTILEGLISSSRDNEQLKIGTFSDKVSYLCDYTSDREILGNVINGITYRDQESYLSDVLYDEITALKETQTNICTRFIVFSDGADDNSVGYTNEEVRSYIGENAYQVYTVGIEGKNDSQELENMFSFSRAAKSEFFLMDGNIACEKVVDSLLQDQEGICLKIAIDESLKDGSSKNILLQLQTPEGSIQLTSRVDMPFGTGIPSKTQGPEETAPTQEAEETAPPEVIESQEESRVETSTQESDKESIQENTEKIIKTSGSETAVNTDKEEIENTGKMPVILIVAGIVLAVMAAAVILILKKKKAAKTLSGKADEKIEEPPAQPEQKKEQESKETDETIMQNQPESRKISGDSDETEGIWLGTPVKYYLVLRCIDRPNIMYKVPIVGSVCIGRAKSSDIVLDDPEVSRSHCEIHLYGEQLYIKDCNSKNKTFYNNDAVYGEVSITDGGTIRIGAHTYCAELVREA